DEVGKGVLLRHQLALVVPQTAHLPAAAHVRNNIKHSAVEQGKTGDRKARVHAGFIRSIAIQQRRTWAIGRKVFALDDAHGNLRSILRNRPLTVSLILIRVVATRDFLFLQQGALTSRDAVLEQLRRLSIGGIRQTDHRRIPLGIAGGTGGVDFLVEVNDRKSTRLNSSHVSISYA